MPSDGNGEMETTEAPVREQRGRGRANGRINGSWHGRDIRGGDQVSGGENEERVRNLNNVKEWECRRCGQKFARRDECREHGRHCSRGTQRAGGNEGRGSEQPNVDENGAGEPDVEMEDLSGEAMGNGDARWNWIQTSDHDGARHHREPSDGRGAITRRSRSRRRNSGEGAAQGNALERRGSQPETQHWDTPEPIEISGEPRSRARGRETRRTEQDSSEPERGDQEGNQATTGESPDEEVNQDDRIPDSGSEEGRETA